MTTRPKLHEKLVSLVAKVTNDRVRDRVKYQPPGKERLIYPSITYKLATPNVIHANNLLYHKTNRYTITVIDKDPDSPLRELVSELPMCTMDTPFTNDGLYHYPFDLYW